MPGRESALQSPPRPMTPFEDRIRTRVMERMRRQKKVGWLSDEEFPRFTFDFLLTPHATKADARALGLRMRETKPHAVALELVGHTPKLVSMLNAVAAKQERPEAVISALSGHLDFGAQLIRELYEADKVAVIPLDIAHTETALMAEWRAVEQQIDEFRDELANSRIGFEEGIDRYRKYLGNFSKINQLREQHSLRQLEEYIISQLVPDKAPFRKVKNARILAHVGMGHAPMVGRLQETHSDTHATLFPPDMVQRHSKEAMATLTLGNEPSQDLLQRGLIENIFGPFILDEIMKAGFRFTDPEVHALIRGIIEQVTPDEIRKLYESNIVLGREAEAHKLLLVKINNVLGKRGRPSY